MPLTESLRAELTTTVKRSRVVLFMKGTRLAPQCGFSATIVQILDELLPTYETVDVLARSDVREGMKELSEWPTFPQLYVEGSFIGGTDIVRELHGTGELAKVLGASVVPAPSPRITIGAAAAKAFAASAPDDGDRLHLTIDSSFAHDLYFGPVEKGEIEIAAGGLKLFMDRTSARRADGLAIDYVERAGGAGFTIDNPNAPPRVQSLSARELDALIKKGSPLELLDVRTDEERAIAVIPGAKPFRAHALDHLAKDAVVVFTCHHGMRSRAAAEEAVRVGYRRVYNLEGGIDAWSVDVDASVPRY